MILSPFDFDFRQNYLEERCKGQGKNGIAQRRKGATKKMRKTCFPAEAQRKEEILVSAWNRARGGTGSQGGILHAAEGFHEKRECRCSLQLV